MSTKNNSRPNLLIGSSLAGEVNNVTQTQRVCNHFFHYTGKLNSAVIIRLSNWLKNQRVKFQKVIIIDEKTLFSSRTIIEQRKVTELYQSLINQVAPYCKRILMIEAPHKCMSKNELNSACFVYNNECDAKFSRMQGQLRAPETTPHLRVQLLTKEALAHECEYFDHTIDWSEVDIRKLTNQDGRRFTDHTKRTLIRYIIEN